MRSLLRSVKKRKNRRVLGEVEVMSREEYSGLELDSKVEVDPNRWTARQPF